MLTAKLIEECRHETEMTLERQTVALLLNELLIPIRGDCDYVRNKGGRYQTVV